jgi:hypothetical protein
VLVVGRDADRVREIGVVEEELGVIRFSDALTGVVWDGVT